MGLWGSTFFGEGSTGEKAKAKSFQRNSAKCPPHFLDLHQKTYPMHPIGICNDMEEKQDDMVFFQKKIFGKKGKKLRRDPLSVLLGHTPPLRTPYRSLQVTLKRLVLGKPIEAMWSKIAGQGFMCLVLFNK